MEKIAGTIMSFDDNGVPYFLIEYIEQFRFIAAEYEEDMTNLGIILKKFKSIAIETEQLSLLDLVDIRYETQHHTPLFLFSLDNGNSLPKVSSPYRWVDTESFRKILGNIMLEDIAGLTF